MIFDDLKHAQRERLIYLDRCLTWRGTANRRDLVTRFGISAAQAALDFRVYLDHARETPPAYDAGRKTYIANRNHKPLSPSNINDAFETVLSPEDGLSSASLPSPSRTADSRVISRIYQAMAGKLSIHIRYTSMSSGADQGQWVYPTHFSSDGESVHIRAFSFKHVEYRNYLPIRIDPGSTFDTRPENELLPDDEDWNTRARIWLQPRTGLSSEQAAAVRREYGFKGDLLCVETRKALEFFINRRWGLNERGARLERVKTDHEPFDQA
jgi:hypothetical protein